MRLLSLLLLVTSFNLFESYANTSKINHNNNKTSKLSSRLHAEESLPFDDFLSIPLAPILPNDSESAIVSKTNIQTQVYKAQLEIQLMKEKYLFDLKMMRQTNILILINTCLFSMSILIFGVCLRDGLIGKISDTGKFIDSIVFNKLTYTYLFGTYFIGLVYVFFGDEIGKVINKVISGVKGVFKRKK